MKALRQSQGEERFGTHFEAIKQPGGQAGR
jgi:hypothetical protein